ncbi:MAG: Ig-like domain-containing protein [Bacteroidaceae bacterium]
MKRLYTLTLVLLVVVSLAAQNMSGIKIYINPGHGGYDSDDRNITIAPYKQGDPNGFWESQSNLDKGQQLKTMLEAKGASTKISRTTNTTADDLGLGTIVRMANEFDSDYFLSIHSNAGVTNYILQLYAGLDPDDTETYPTATPFSKEGREIGTIVAENQYSNQANTWAAKPTVRGDKTFARTAMKWDDGYGVLRGLRVPGAISEGSMHDYIPETYRLMNMDYKWLEAWHFMKSFCTYFKCGTIPTGNIVGTIHDSRNKNEATYRKIKDTKDELLPLCGATVTLNPGNKVYKTDALFNGVFVFKDLQPGEYTVKYEATDYYGKTEKLVVKANETTYSNMMLDMVRNTPPEVLSYSPKSDISVPVETSSRIEFNFNWDVDDVTAIKAFSITPAAEGTFTFEDSNHRMIFKPSTPLEKDMLYTVKLDKSLQHRGGMTMTADFSFQFKTKNRNRLAVITSYPYDGADGVSSVNAAFFFVFDQKINTSNLDTNIKVYDKMGTALNITPRSFLKNMVKAPLGSVAFNLTYNLTPGDTYKVVIGGAVKDVNEVTVTEDYVCNFKVADVRVVDKPVMETFEIASVLATDEAASVTTSALSTAFNNARKLFDLGSYELKYTFKGMSGGEALYKFVNPTVVVDASKMIGLHIYGDLTGNELQLQLTSSADVQYVPLTLLNYAGWHYAQAELPLLQLGTPYKVTGIKVVQVEGPINTTGQIYVDNLLTFVNPTSGVEQESVTQMKVYPNPTSDKIRVDCPQDKACSLTLYTLAGTVVMSLDNALEMNIAHLPAGSYLLKANEQYFKITKK